MKKIRIVQAAIMIAIVGLLTSCDSHYYPRSSTSFSLILSPRSGYLRYPDGRYYYRSPEGYTYWRGYDNRYYLDRQYIGRGHYDQREYNEWRRNDDHGNRRRHR